MNTATTTHTTQNKVANSFQAIHAEAEIAGRAAGYGNEPDPMYVTDGVKTWKCNEGTCGFAWVVIDGNTAFGRAAKASGVFSKGYPKGLHYWISMYGQSLERKEAHADAYAKVLVKHGIKAYSMSRMD